MSIARVRVGGALPRVLLVDGVLAAVIGFFVMEGSWHAGASQFPPPRALDTLGYVLIGLAAGPLFVRRVWPLGTLAITVPAIAIFLGLSYPYGPILFTMLIAMYSVAARLPAKASLVACGFAIAVLFLGHVAAVFSGTGGLATQAVHMVTSALAPLLPWAVGTVIRLRRENVVRAREERARRGRDEERLRVAREVHDVVGHGLAVINMQASVALHVLDRRPEQARPALEAVKRTSKESLEELRSTLAVFRQPEAGDGSGEAAQSGGSGEAAESRRPALGLHQLGSLVDSMAASGLPVDVFMTGERGEVPASVDLAAYRIVQESLTNVLRHAGGAAATVRVGYRPGAVALEITNDGGAYPVDGARAPGHGIAGMRERAAAVGGSLEAGPRPEGGFAVRARLPFGRNGA